jgi:hypothetical protein
LIHLDTNLENLCKEYYSFYAIFFFQGRFQKNGNMKPMGLNSTRFVSYHDIKVKDADLIEDAWGLNAQFSDVIDILRYVKAVPEENLTEKLIDKIRNHH